MMNERRNVVNLSFIIQHSSLLLHAVVRRRVTLAREYFETLATAVGEFDFNHPAAPVKGARRLVCEQVLRAQLTRHLRKRTFEREHVAGEEGLPAGLFTEPI